MRFLANENFPYDAIVALRSSGHDVAWVLTDSPGISDDKVIERATREKRIILTFDKDFGELAFKSNLLAPCGIILFRIFLPSSSTVAQKVSEVLSSQLDWEGCFTVVEDDKIRSRPLPKS